MAAILAMAMANCGSCKDTKAVNCVPESSEPLCNGGMTTYTPGFWNDAGTTQANNNCYNYSNNKQTNGFAQPGRRTGCESASMSCAAVRAAAIADGIIAADSSSSCPTSQSLLALVVEPGTDYHWYRLDSNAFWTHKPGQTEATNLDNSGNAITNPEIADRGDYTEFCGYFCSCSSSTEGAGSESIQ